MSRLARLTDGELVERLKLVEKHKGNKSAAAREMGLSSSAMRESVLEARRRGLTAQTRTVDAEAKLRTKLQLAERELAMVRRDNDTAESIRKEIFGLAAMTPEPPRWLMPKRKSTKNDSIPVVIWSDWHFGERVNRVEVGGVNEFDRAIAKKRVQKLVAKTIELCKHHMVKPNYEGIVVCLGGDMITGAIHEELGATNDGTVQQALWELQGVLIWALNAIADEFGRVFVPCVVGNHARDTHRPRMKGAVLQNYEWTLYNQLELYFKDDKRIRFMIPGETDAFFAVKGHKFLLTHGDRLGVGGGDGQIGALGPITRGTIKVGRSEKQIGRDFDTMLCCHYHTYIPRSEACPVIVNGALKGYDEYARLGLRVPYSRPSQALFFVNDTYGITAQWQIFLEAKQTSLKGKTGWVSWQQNNRYDARAAA
jgi:transposase-like protein